MYRLKYIFRFPVHFESFLSNLQFGSGNIHKLPELRSLKDDMISVLAEHFVHQRRRGVYFEISLLIVLFEIEQFLIEGVYMREEPCFYFMFVEKHAYFCIGGIIELFSVCEFVLLVSCMISGAGSQQGRMFGIVCLNDNGSGWIFLK